MAKMTGLIGYGLAGLGKGMGEAGAANFKATTEGIQSSYKDEVLAMREMNLARFSADEANKRLETEIGAKKELSAAEQEAAKLRNEASLASAEKIETGKRVDEVRKGYRQQAESEAKIKAESQEPTGTPAYYEIDGKTYFGTFNKSGKFIKAELGSGATVIGKSGEKGEGREGKPATLSEPLQAALEGMPPTAWKYAGILQEQKANDSFIIGEVKDKWESATTQASRELGRDANDPAVRSRAVQIFNNSIMGKSQPGAGGRPSAAQYDQPSQPQAVKPAQPKVGLLGRKTAPDAAEQVPILGGVRSLLRGNIKVPTGEKLSMEDIAAGRGTN